MEDVLFAEFVCGFLTSIFLGSARHNYVHGTYFLLVSLVAMQDEVGRNVATGTIYNIPVGVARIFTGLISENAMHLLRG